MYTFIDFETTGLDHTTEQIIEIGAIRLDADLNEIDTLHTMVRLDAGRVLPDIITKITGIVADDLKDGISEQEGADALAAFIGADDYVVAQFASFDLGFLSRYYEAGKFMCTRTMSRLLNPSEKASLKDLVLRYDIKLENPHRAFADVQATVEVFKVMSKELDVKGTEYANVMIDSIERPLKYIPLRATVITMDI